MYTFILLFLLLLPSAVFAQYTPIVNIPLPTGADANFQNYINAIYALSISIAALLAVIKIVIAGVKWMTTDIIPAKGEAKKDIQGALVGLLLIIAAVIIINIINPNIAQVNFALNTIEVRETPPADADTLALRAIEDECESQVSCEVISCLTTIDGEQTFNCEAVAADQCDGEVSEVESNRRILCYSNIDLLEVENNCAENPDCEIIACGRLSGCSDDILACEVDGNLPRIVVEQGGLFSGFSEGVISCTSETYSQTTEERRTACIDDSTCSVNTCTPTTGDSTNFDCIEKREACETDGGTAEPLDVATFICRD